MTLSTDHAKPLGPLMVDVADTVLTGEEREFLLHPAVGGVILFSRNYESPKQIQHLVREIKALRFPSLLVAVDQEGGRVQRFREGFRTLPALYTLGLSYRTGPDQARVLARSAGRLMAAELRQLDVDFSFAPVLDIADLESTVIGKRAFHEDEQVITDLALSYIQGMNSAGMQATGKHFPGHGRVRADSHLETPVDTRSLDELWKADLVPYRSLAPYLGGVMTAHIHFPEVEAQLPTYSGFWIGDVLRHRIGFQGVVFSDDLSMQGAATIVSSAERVRLALFAGCDMALVCNDPPAARIAANHLESMGIEHRSDLTRMSGTECHLEEDELSRLDEQLQPLFELV